VPVHHRRSSVLYLRIRTALVHSGPAAVKQAHGKTRTVVLQVLALIVVVVFVDVLFFRHQFRPRLIANVGIVLVFGAVYWRFLRH
jgi:hypothetical protein